MSKSRFKTNRRDPGRFIQLPTQLWESDAAKTLSAHESRLLMDLAFQYAGMNNGRLLAGWKYMNEARGWSSKDTLNKCVAALTTRGLIVKTRQGQMPNKSSWFACTWWALDWSPEMEIAEQSFPRGAYARWKPTEKNALMCTTTVPIGGPIGTATVLGQSL